MHELSIVLSIVHTVSDELIKSECSVVDEIELEIGELSGVDLAAFDFAWSEAVKNTPLASAVRKILQPSGQFRCMDCDHEFKSVKPVSECPQCKSYLTFAIKGKELRIKSILAS